MQYNSISDHYISTFEYIFLFYIILFFYIRVKENVFFKIKYHSDLHTVGEKIGKNKSFFLSVQSITKRPTAWYRWLVTIRSEQTSGLRCYLCPIYHEKAWRKRRMTRQLAEATSKRRGCRLSVIISHWLLGGNPSVWGSAGSHQQQRVTKTELQADHQWNPVMTTGPTGQDWGGAGGVGGEVQGGSFSDLSDGATACGPTATEAPTDVLGELPHSSPLFGGIFLNCLEFRVKSRHKQRTLFFNIHCCSTEERPAWVQSWGSSSGDCNEILLKYFPRMLWVDRKTKCYCQHSYITGGR